MVLRVVHSRGVSRSRIFQYWLPRDWKETLFDKYCSSTQCDNSAIKSSSLIHDVVEHPWAYSTTHELFIDTKVKRDRRKKFLEKLELSRKAGRTNDSLHDCYMLSFEDFQFLSPTCIKKKES